MLPAGVAFRFGLVVSWFAAGGGLGSCAGVGIVSAVEVVVNTPLSRSAYARHIVREVYVSLVVCYATVSTFHRQPRIRIITRAAININADMIPGQRTTHAIRQPNLDYIIAPALHKTPRCPRRRKILRLLHRDQLESLRTRNGRPLPTNRETIHSSTNKRPEVRIHHIASERLFHCHRKSSPHISDTNRRTIRQTHETRANTSPLLSGRSTADPKLTHPRCQRKASPPAQAGLRISPDRGSSVRFRRTAWIVKPTTLPVAGLAQFV